MENLIYWTGVGALLAFFCFVVVILCWLICLLIRERIADDLKSTYNHVKLKFLIGRVKSSGYSKTLEELKKAELKI